MIKQEAIERVVQAWAGIKDKPISLPMLHDTDVDAPAFAQLADAMRDLEEHAE